MFIVIKVLQHNLLASFVLANLEFLVSSLFPVCVLSLLQTRDKFIHAIGKKKYPKLFSFCFIYTKSWEIFYSDFFSHLKNLVFFTAFNLLKATEAIPKRNSWADNTVWRIYRIFPKRLFFHCNPVLNHLSKSKNLNPLEASI